MIRNILVPLDGSALAEAALPAAIWVSGLFGSTVTLLHVIEHNAPENVHGEHHLKAREEALAYLQEVATRFPPSIKTELHVHSEEVRNVPRSIGLHVDEMIVDMVVMCTHGRSGIRQFMMGSNAQRVIGFGSVPVLLVQPQHDQQALFAHPTNIVVALDDDPDHSCGLGLAGLIARQAGVEMRLLTVVPKLDTLRGSEAAAGKLLPATTIALLEIENESALNMLTEQAKPWMEKQVNVTFDVRRGDPPAQIVAGAREANASMIVLGTHGKRGMGAFWAGSVAARIPALTDLPLLLVPTCRIYE